MNTKENLETLRGSKYIQSNKGDIFKQIESDLKVGNKVFFVGVPCDVAALMSYLRKPYETLLTADLICYGCTTPMIADQYISRAEKKFKSSVEYMTIKDKSSGWENPSLYMEFKNGRSYRKIFRNTEYGVAFNKMIRKSCYSCSFKGENRWSDLTLGDYWGIPKTHELYNINGVSLLYINTKKGRDALGWLEDFKFVKVNGESARRCNVSLDCCQAPRDVESFRRKFKRKGLVATHDYKFWIRTLLPERWIYMIKKICR